MVDANSPPDLMTDDPSNGLPCATKLTFASQEQAEAAAAADAYWHGSRLYTYLCRYCQQWHLTSQPSDED